MSKIEKRCSKKKASKLTIQHHSKKKDLLNGLETKMEGEEWPSGRMIRKRWWGEYEKNHKKKQKIYKNAPLKENEWMESFLEALFVHVKKNHLIFLNLDLVKERA